MAKATVLKTSIGLLLCIYFSVLPLHIFALDRKDLALVVVTGTIIWGSYELSKKMDALERRIGQRNSDKDRLATIENELRRVSGIVDNTKTVVCRMGAILDNDEKRRDDGSTCSICCEKKYPRILGYCEGNHDDSPICTECLGRLRQCPQCARSFIYQPTTPLRSPVPQPASGPSAPPAGPARTHPVERPAGRMRNSGSGDSSCTIM